MCFQSYAVNQDIHFIRYSVKSIRISLIVSCPYLNVLLDLSLIDDHLSFDLSFSCSYERKKHLTNQLRTETFYRQN